MIKFWILKNHGKTAFCLSGAPALQTDTADSVGTCKPVHSSKKESDQGSVLLFIVGLCLVLLLVASTVVGVSSVYLERHRLQALADQAATSAAQRVEGVSATSDTGGALIHLNNATVAQSAQAFLNESGAAGNFSNLAMSPGTGVSGNSTAVVVLSATAHPPLVSVVVPKGVNITVTGKARATATQNQ